MLNLSHCHSYFNNVASELAHMTKLKDKALKMLLFSLVSSNYWDPRDITMEETLVTFKDTCDFFSLPSLLSAAPSISFCFKRISQVPILLDHISHRIM